MELRMVQGNIVNENTEVLVNAANSNLILGDGVAGAIRKMGGPSIQEECNKKAPMPLGEVAITGAGNLKAKFIYHAVTMKPGGKSNPEIISNAVHNILRLAFKNNIKKMSMPAIGCGIAGINIIEGANTILKANLNILCTIRYITSRKLRIFVDDRVPNNKLEANAGRIF